MQIKLPPYVVEILDKFEKAGFEVYIVGGAVRNILMGRKPPDWDFTTNATPEEILKIFPDGFYDNSFGTVGISHKSSKKPYEITTFRREVGYSDKRHPDKIEWGKTLKEDLARRDFTINAMALDKGQKLTDPFGGQGDLKKKIIKAVGDPVKRFREDALRMMRAVRIAAELGFVITEATFEAIKMHADSIKHVSVERIHDELFRILASDYPY